MASPLARERCLSARPAHFAAPSSVKGPLLPALPRGGVAFGGTLLCIPLHGPFEAQPPLGLLGAMVKATRGLLVNW